MDMCRRHPDVVFVLQTHSTTNQGRLELRDSAVRSEGTEHSFVTILKHLEKAALLLRW